MNHQSNKLADQFTKQWMSEHDDFVAAAIERGGPMMGKVIAVSIEAGYIGALLHKATPSIIDVSEQLQDRIQKQEQQ